MTNNNPSTPSSISYNKDTMLDNVNVDPVFAEKVKQWRKKNWRISPQSIKNLEDSIERGKNKFGDSNK